MSRKQVGCQPNICPKRTDLIYPLIMHIKMEKLTPGDFQSVTRINISNHSSRTLSDTRMPTLSGTPCFVLRL